MISQLETFLAIFPLLLPVWQERPIVRDDIYPTRYPIEMTGEEVRMLAQGLELVDQELRCCLAQHLRVADSNAAYGVLVDRIPKEKDYAVLAAILQQLAYMSNTSPKVDRAMPLLLKHPDVSVRFWAVALCAKTPAPDFAMLCKLAMEDTDIMVREAAASALRTRSDDVDLVSLVGLWASKDRAVRAHAHAASCAKSGLAVHRDAILAACADEAVIVRLALAEGFPALDDDTAAAVAGKLVSDSHASVRAALAKSIGQRGDNTFQPLLLQLSRDTDPEVKRETAEALQYYPNQGSLDALVQLLYDHGNLVRCRAEESIVTIHPEFAVITTVFPRLSADDEYVRYHVMRILGRLDARQHSQAIADALEREIRPENVGAAAMALGLLEAHFATVAVESRYEHSSDIVREQVARALGRLKQPQTYPTLNKLIFDSEENVRHAAIISAGWTADGNAFNESMLKALKIFSEIEMSSENRGAVCWALGRLRPCTKPLMKRLVKQTTTPVIPTPEGPMFEEDAVLISGAFALAQCAKDDAFARERAEYVLGKCAYKPVSTQAMHATNVSFIPSAEVREYGARQATAFMEDKSVEQLPRPTRSLLQRYGKYERKTY